MFSFVYIVLLRVTLPTFCAQRSISSLILPSITYYYLFENEQSDAKWCDKMILKLNGTQGEAWEWDRESTYSKNNCAYQFYHHFIIHRVAWTMPWEVLIVSSTHTFSTFTNWQHWKIACHIVCFCAHTVLYRDDERDNPWKYHSRFNYDRKNVLIFISSHFLHFQKLIRAFRCMCQLILRFQWRLCVPDLFFRCVFWSHWFDNVDVCESRCFFNANFNRAINCLIFDFIFIPYYVKNRQMKTLLVCWIKCNYCIYK